MVKYICPRCQYDAKQKSNFRRHILRKKICKPILSDISILNIAKEYNIVIASKKRKMHDFGLQMTPIVTPNDSNTTPNDSNIKIFFYCKFCNNKFTRLNNRNRHENYRCKIKKQLDLEKENKKLKYELSKLKNKKLNTTINNINKGTINKGTINKGTINNITINQFFDTENENIFDRLNNKKILKYLNSKSYDNLLSLLCKQIYFNDKFPEDKNIKCTNLQSKLCDVFIDDSFKKMQKKKAYEHLTDKMVFLIQDLGDENKEKINNKGHKNLNLTQETLDNPEQHYDTINLELYNNTKNMNI